VQRRINIKSNALIGLSDAAITMYLAGIDADEDEEIWNIKEKCKPDFTTLSAHRALQFSPLYCALATVIQGHVATPGDVTVEAQTLAPATRSRLPTGAYNTNQAFEEMGLSRLYITKKSPGAAGNMERMRRRNSASCSDVSHAGDESADKSASGKLGATLSLQQEMNLMKMIAAQHPESLTAVIPLGAPMAATQPIPVSRRAVLIYRSTSIGRCVKKRLSAF
jgi:hypothetical protein